MVNCRVVLGLNVGPSMIRCTKIVSFAALFPPFPVFDTPLASFHALLKNFTLAYNRYLAQ